MVVPLLLIAGYAGLLAGVVFALTGPWRDAAFAMSPLVLWGLGLIWYLGLFRIALLVEARLFLRFSYVFSTFQKSFLSDWGSRDYFQLAVSIMIAATLAHCTILFGLAEAMPALLDSPGWLVAAAGMVLLAGMVNTVFLVLAWSVYRMLPEAE